MTITNQNSVADYLAKQQKDATPAMAEEWTYIEEVYNKKLWHQVTLKLVELIRKPELLSGEQLIDLYNNFISTFENKINALSLVEITAVVITQYKDPNAAIEFIQKIQQKVKVNADAQNLCQVLIGQIYLKDLKDFEATKRIIEATGEILDGTDGVTPVHGRFYLLASQYYRIEGDHAQYYRTALRYLGCIDTDQLAADDQVQHAFFLGLAALLGDGVYNMGELLAHPVLDSLRGTDNDWLVELLQAFNSGDITKYEAMRPKWSKIADLKAKELFLRQKISLLCLMEMTFKRAAHNRQLTFQEIATATQLPIQEIELLVMKALSQQLVKGAIDQVANTVNLTWVQPRVLNKTQIANMIEHLNDWSLHVNKMEQLVEDNAHEILT